MQPLSRDQPPGSLFVSATAKGSSPSGSPPDSRQPALIATVVISARREEAQTVVAICPPHLLRRKKKISECFHNHNCRGSCQETPTGSCPWKGFVWIRAC